MRHMFSGSKSEIIFWLSFLCFSPLIFFFQFLQDLYSGKLHREFHYGPDKDTSSDAPDAGGDDQKQLDAKAAVQAGKAAEDQLRIAQNEVRFPPL